MVVWDVANWKKHDEWKAGTECVVSVELSADGRTLVSGATDGMVRVWRADGGPDPNRKPVSEWKAADWCCVKSVGLSPDGTRVVSVAVLCSASDYDKRTVYGRMREWKRDGGRVTEGQTWQPDTTFQQAKFLTDKTVIHSTWEGKVFVWPDGSDEYALDTKCRGYMHFLPSADRTRLLTIGEDGAVRWWDVKKQKQLEVIATRPSRWPQVAMHPTARVIAACDGSTVRLLQLTDK